MLRARVPQEHGARTSKGGVETFIVRIYRRAPDSTEGPAGTVECVGCGERQGFAGRDELWDRLFRGEAHAHEREAPDSGAGSAHASGVDGAGETRRKDYGESHGE